VDGLNLEAAKSKVAFEALTRRMKLSEALVVDDKANVNLHRSVRNLDKFDVLPPEGFNLESALRRKHLVLTTAAAKALEGALS
jgi:large subunit ribosomal protein L4